MKTFDKHDDLPWFTMIYHDLSWFTMIYHDLPWFTMIYHDLPWFPYKKWWFSTSQRAEMGPKRRPGPGRDPVGPVAPVAAPKHSGCPARPGGDKNHTCPGQVGGDHGDHGKKPSNLPSGNLT